MLEKIIPKVGGIAAEKLAEAAIGAAAPALTAAGAAAPAAALVAVQVATSPQSAPIKKSLADQIDREDIEQEQEEEISW